MLLPFVLAALISFVSTPAVIKFAQHFGLIDDPRTHRHPKVIHTYPTPRGGGIAIFLGIFITSWFFLPADKYLLGILTGACLVTILGILDDKFDLNPYLRLVAQLAIASIPVFLGIRIGFTTRPFGGIINLPQPAIYLFAIFWIVFLMNILNMGAKGVDGQLPGVAVIASLTIAFLSLRYSADIAQWPIILLALITAGAFLGFLPWNIYPQKIMPSYSGSTLAGYMLAVLSILSTAKVGTLIVVLGIPLVDTGYTIVRRILSGKSPVWGDRGHLHHRLFDAGLSKRKIALFYWLGTALLGWLALNLNAEFKLYTIIFISLVIGGVLLWLTYKPKN